MAQRQQLHNILLAILGTNNVYFQPPSNTKIQYPCIIYKRDDVNTVFANDKPYNIKKRYQITVIDRNPDSVIPDKIAALKECVFDRHYTADSLNHDVYKLYF